MDTDEEETEGNQHNAVSTGRLNPSDSEPDHVEGLTQAAPAGPTIAGAYRCALAWLIGATVARSVIV